MIGLKTIRTGGPILTDEPRVVRRIGYAVWRYVTGADLREVEARYVDRVFFITPRSAKDDWSWYKGQQGYASLYECLVDALEHFREDLYVDKDPNRVADQGAHYSNVVLSNASRIRAKHGVDLLAAIRSIVDSLIQSEALEVGDCILGNHTWFLDVDALDSWVAAMLIQLPDGSIDHDASLAHR